MFPPPRAMRCDLNWWSGISSLWIGCDRRGNNTVGDGFPVPRTRCVRPRAARRIPPSFAAANDWGIQENRTQQKQCHRPFCCETSQTTVLLFVKERFVLWDFTFYGGRDIIRQKGGEIMRFVFSGTLDELKETISVKAKEYNKNILVHHAKPNTLEIGFQRLGHSGGRFFVATINEENNTIVLDGDIRDLDSHSPRNKIQEMLDSICAWAVAYLIVAVVPVLLWLCIFQLQHIWISLVLPIPILAICRINAKKQQKKTDADFVKFMSLFSTYTDDEACACGPCWDDAYKRLDLACGTMQSIRDDDEDMLLITYEDGMQIDVGYIEKEKTYYVTVMSSDTMESWNNPLGIFATKDKSKLADELQKAIYKFRNI